MDVTQVTQSVDKETLEELLKAARECAEDLVAELNDRYPAREDQPVQARRHERDIAVAHRVIKLCTILDGRQ